MLRCLPVLLLLAGPAHAEPDPVHGLVAIGIGAPNLLHATAGGFVLDRLSVEARGGVWIFNALAGVGATYHALGDDQPGRPPRHALLIDAQAQLNVDQWPPDLSGGGERIGGLVGVAGGYGLLTDGGFLLRVRAGAIFHEDAGFGAGPDFTVGAGWAF